MDAKHATQVDTSTLRTIGSRPIEWVAAAPNPVLNIGLATAWIGFLWAIGMFSPAPETITTELSALDNLGLAMFLATLAGLMSVVGLALTNSDRTAAVSGVCAISMVTIGTLCGFAGHPISAWGPNTAFAAVIGFASLAVAARRG